MEFSKTVRTLLAAGLVVLNYLQLEASFSHPVHVAIACGSLFIGALGINAAPQPTSDNEVKI